MTRSITGYLTLMEIVAQVSEPEYIVKYAIGRHGPTCDATVGGVRLWRKDRLPLIRKALKQTALRSTVATRREAALA